jgi:hypothetical protein
VCRGQCSPRRPVACMRLVQCLCRAVRTPAGLIEQLVPPAGEACQVQAEATAGVRRAVHRHRHHPGAVLRARRSAAHHACEAHRRVRGGHACMHACLWWPCMHACMHVCGGHACMHACLWLQPPCLCSSIMRVVVHCCHDDASMQVHAAAVCHHCNNYVDWQKHGCSDAAALACVGIICTCPFAPGTTAGLWPGWTVCWSAAGRGSGLWRWRWWAAALAALSWRWLCSTG